MPASIDYILAKTHQTKLQFIAHSQGSTAFFVMVSERPEYNDKIEMMHAMAPGVFMSHTRSPLIRVILPFLSVLEVNFSTKVCYCFFFFFGVLKFVKFNLQKLKALLGVHSLVLSKRFRVLAAEFLCKDNAAAQRICDSVLFLLFGYDPLNSVCVPNKQTHLIIPISRHKTNSIYI